MTIDCPRHAPLTVCPDDDGLVLHDPHTGSTHRLNGTAQYIWEQCDGHRDPIALARVVAARFGIPQAEAQRDVDAALVQFRYAGLIQSPGASAREREVLMWAVGTALGSTRQGPADGHPGVDWNALVHLSVDHGVMPLLYRCVADHWQDTVPPLVVERLERQYAANAVVIEGFLSELLDVIGELASRDIAALPLKGPAMAHWLYGSAALRQFGDLDIFVAPDHAERACDILRGRGYEFIARRRTDAVAVRASAVGEIVVDLQWAVARHFYRFPVALEELWDRAATIDIHGLAVRQPQPGDLLLILCAHASKHCWSALIWIADIAAFLRVFGERVDWAHLLAHAAEAGGERQLLLGLRLARDLLGAQLPGPVVERIGASPSLDPLVTAVRRALFAPASQRTFQGSFGVIRGGIFYMRTRERLRDRLPYVGHLLRESAAALVELTRPNHHDRAVIALPSSLAFLYYGIRLARVTVKYGARWMGRTDRTP
jgi:hypothetical protein